MECLAYELYVVFLWSKRSRSKTEYFVLMYGLTYTINYVIFFDFSLST